MPLLADHRRKRMAMFRFDVDSDELADGYERASALLFTAGRQLIESLHLELGHRVLDVGCGTGLLADYVSRVVGPQGYVIGVEPLPRRIEIARRQHRRANLEFIVGSALDLSVLPAASVDAAYLHFVLHWLPDCIGPLRQLARVLKRGARIGLTTAADGVANTFDATCDHVLSRAPYNQFPAEQRVKSHRVRVDELDKALSLAGFGASNLRTERSVAHWRTAEQAIAFYETISGGNLFGHLHGSLRQSARAALADALESLRESDGIRVEGSRITAVASLVSPPPGSTHTSDVVGTQQ